MTGNEKTKMSFEEFCERLRSDGAYIGEDWHVYSKNGKCLKKQFPNKYYCTRKRYDGIDYYFMEHRVIWYFLNGSIPDGLQINHKDFDRTNNNINNLELVTAKENLKYSRDAGRMNVAKAEKSGRAIFTNKEAQAMRWLKKHGWSYREITKLFGGTSEYCIGRIIRGKRYGSVPDTEDVKDIFPTIALKRKKGTDVIKALEELETDTENLLEIKDNNEIVSKIGDILCNVIYLGSSIGIDMSNILKTEEYVK